MKKGILLIGIFILILFGFQQYKQYKTINNDKGISNNVKEDNNIDNSKDPEIKKAKITLVGDFLFEQPFYDSINAGDNKDNYFKNVKKYFLDDDLSIGNMEVVIGNDKLTPSGTGFNFCAPKYIGDLVNTLDLEVLATANNHAYDRGREGMISTLEYFKNNSDILTVGTYLNDEDLNTKRILKINGIKFGFLSYTYGTNQKVDKEYLKYIGLYRDPDTKIVTEEYKNKIKKDVENLRNDVDVLIVIMHWGIEFTHTPNKEQEEMANYLNNLGVDIIMGSHSHSMEPIKWIGDSNKTLVYYSMGNFVSADDDVSRAGEDFDNAYQIGLLSTLDVRKNKDKIEIDNVKTKAIINYYDKNMRNFMLIPYEMYTEDYEKSHYRYEYNFNREFIKNMYEKVIAEEFR